MLNQGKIKKIIMKRDTGDIVDSTQVRKINMEQLARKLISQKQTFLSRGLTPFKLNFLL